MRDQILVKVTVVTDDSTGCYEVGELDFGIPGSTIDWLNLDKDHAEELAKHLEWLADKCRKREIPFY